MAGPTTPEGYPACVGCGYCCQKAVCVVGLLHYGPGEKTSGDCKFLLTDDGRYWCQLILQAEGEKKKRLMKEMAIDCGCSSSMLNTQRSRAIRRMR